MCSIAETFTHQVVKAPHKQEHQSWRVAEIHTSQPSECRSGSHSKVSEDNSMATSQRAKSMQKFFRACWDLGELLRVGLSWEHDSARENRQSKTNTSCTFFVACLVSAASSRGRRAAKELDLSSLVGLWCWHVKLRLGTCCRSGGPCMLAHWWCGGTIVTVGCFPTPNPKTVGWVFLP